MRPGRSGPPAQNVGVDIDLRLLRYFVAVAEELHFTRAADRLYLSQPALSNQIRRLEHELDVALFDRSTRAVRLTEAGEAFLPRAREALAAVSLGVTEALAAAGQADGLRLDILESALETPRAVLGQLRALYPALPVRTSTVGTPGQQRQILAGDLDVGLAGVGDLPAAIDQRVVRREPVGVALRADHPLAGLARVPVRALATRSITCPATTSRRSGTRSCGGCAGRPGSSRGATRSAPTARPPRWTWSAREAAS